MSNAGLTVRELLYCSGEQLDPLNIDTNEIRVLSASLPKDGNIDINNAEVLATKYLRGADLCAELMAIATAHVQRTDTIMKKAYSYAALVTSEDYFTNRNGGKRPDKITDKMRTLYADMDDDYVTSCNRHDEAVAFAKWVNGKYDSFNKMHYHLRKVLDRGYTHEKISGWERDIIGNKEDEYQAVPDPPSAESTQNEKNSDEWWK
jgi:hypothetical protein